jgi:peroxiredoxin
MAVQPARIGAFLLVVTAVFVNLAQADVRAAETILKPWTEDRLPLFTLDALTGERTDLAQLRRRAVLVHFFATWCEPCRTELTALQRLHDRMREKSFTVVGVDAGEVESRVQRFFAEQPVSFPILLDRDRAMSKAWQVYVLPTTFLLDGNLVPRFVAEGDFDWSRPEVEETLTKLITPKAAAGEVRRAFAQR